MRLNERVGIWLLTARTGARAADDAQLRAHRRALLERGPAIAAAAGALIDDPAAARRLAARYVSALWERERELEWWQANGDYLAQPWFVLQYARAQGWLCAPEAAPAPELYALQPEGAALGRVVLSVKRRLDAPEQGELELDATPPELPEELAHALHCTRLESGRYARAIREVHGAIVERAVELGVTLLEAGYELCVAERALRDRIAEGRFEPMHRYWIYEAAQPERLCLWYPWDARLHAYVRQAGARWTGRRMEIPITQASELHELALRYGFRFTVEAQRRLEAWHAASLYATIYRKRVRKPDAAAVQDEFVRLLERPIRVPEDLYDD